MMQKIGGTKLVFYFYFLLFFFHCNYANEECSIVFVHLGEQIPVYSITAIEQTRLFNPDVPIFFIINENSNHTMIKNLGINIIYCEELISSDEHIKFMMESNLDRISFDSFWIKTTERFFYLEELIMKLNLKNVFHLECDVMLYIDLSSILNTFKSYKNIAAIFDNDNRCIPSFLYFSNKQSARKLVQFISDNSSLGMNDMEILAHYKKVAGQAAIDHLPIVIDSFAENSVLTNKLGDDVKDKKLYYRNFNLFQSIFDAAALGQYLGGISPRNGGGLPGFINERCIFDPSLFNYEWALDQYGRKIPYIVYDNHKYRINNLHIHSKKLYDFRS